jgi:pimeloyl-ACP methyl ester carboxylesterase
MRVRSYRLLRGVIVVGLVLAALIGWQWQEDLPLGQLQARYGGGASRYVDIDGLSVHYRDEGSGPPIVLIHGSGASLHTWEGWAASLTQGGYRVIRLDLPGFGLTGPSPRGDYRTAAYVAFIERFVSQLGLDRFVLGGNSLGGLIAWRYAVGMPQRLRGLILVDATGYSLKRPAPLAFKLGKLPLLVPLFTHLNPRWMAGLTLRRSYGDPSRVSDELIDRYSQLSLRPGNRAAFIARAGLSFEDRTEDLHSLQLPTLVMWGKKDNLVPVTMASRFAGDIPGATLQVYDDLGHVPMEEEPTRSAADTKRFLDHLPR